MNVNRLVDEAKASGVLQIAVRDVARRERVKISTFAIRDNEFRISLSLSVPKIAVICDIGHGCDASTCGPLRATD
jgi:hypothetical protein